MNCDQFRNPDLFGSKPARIVRVRLTRSCRYALVIAAAILMAGAALVRLMYGQ